jgi:hypothetical protein
VGPPGTIAILADELPVVVDPEGLSPCRAWNIDFREHPVVQEKAMGQVERRRVRVLAVGADHLAPCVHL